MKRLDGKNIAAVWTENIEQKVKLNFKGKIQTFDYMGKPVNIDFKNFYATPRVIYITGFNSLFLN